MSVTVVQALKVGDKIIWKWPTYSYDQGGLHTGTIEHITTNDWICVREKHHWLLTFWYKIFDIETEWIRIDKLASFARITDNDSKLPT